VARPQGESDAPGAAWGSPRGPGGTTGLEAASGSAPDWCERGRSGSIGTPLTPGIADKPDTHVSLCPRGPFHDCLTLRRRRLSRTGAVLRRMRTAKTLPGPLSRADVSIGPGRQALRQLRRGDHVQPDGAWSRQAVKVSADPGSLHAPRREGVAAEAVGHRPEDGVVALQCRLHRVRGRPP